MPAGDRRPAWSRVLVGVVVGGAIAACAQIEGLDHYEKVDCLDDCADASGDVLAAPPPGPADTGVDSPSCPPCSGSTPACDPTSHLCVECLPGKLACAAGYFCDPDPNLGFHCVLGCGVVDDCIKVLSKEAGVEAGDGGDAGALFASIACCNNRCIDTSTSNAHCGMCGNACNIGAACCGSVCTDVTSNENACGGCGKVCSTNHISMPTCTLGKCSGACDVGFDDCNHDKLTDGCEADIFNDPTRCGACNRSCSSNHILAVHCSAGTCDGACDSVNGWADCNDNKLVDGCEANITNDPAHCGACVNQCSNNHLMTPTCAMSACNGTCDPGYKNCVGTKLANGCETNVATNADDCGDCGLVCSNNNMATRTCAAGVCNGMCLPGFADCNNNKLTDGCEVSTATDPAHCGACVGKVCSNNHIATPTCGAGVCNGTCDAGWSDCNNNKLLDGCEAKTDQDTLHCGAACAACPAGMRNCVGGTCTPGYGQTVAAIGFVDACAAAGGTTYLQNSDDGVTGLLALPFPFTFYGTAHTQFWASADGYIAFSGTPAIQFNQTCPLWNANDPHPAILGYGQDLVLGNAGLCVATVGAAPNRKLVVTFKNAYLFFDTGTDLTFSIMLEETTNRVDLVYQTLTSAGLRADGSEAVVGIQSDTPLDQATITSCQSGAAVLTPGMAIQYIP
jgi:hypothetical protein